MFHEIFLAPFTQTRKFRSPDVALLPFVRGSTHAVMTPLRTPGLWALVAPAIAVTAANKTTAAAANSSFVDGDFIPSSFQVPKAAEVRSLDWLQRSLVGRLRQSNVSPRSTANDARPNTLGLTPPAAAS
jgi:hypothetical protein